MLDTLNLANSIWPNGIQVDSDGYAVFHPLGTNKIEVPKSSAEWPKGDKLISPFVYNENDENDEVVGFIDTKALIVSENTTIYLPYKHIEANFSSIEKGKLSIHAPNATTKKVSWKDSGMEDITEAQYKYKGYKTTDQIKSDFGYDYLADIANGTWSEPLWDLEDGNRLLMNSGFANFASDLPSLTNGEYMFWGCRNLTTFDKDLSSLTNGRNMFSSCANLESFSSDLSTLTDGERMFSSCDNLESFSSDLSSLTNGREMFDGCWKLSSFSSDLSSLTNGSNMFDYCTALKSFTSDLSSLTNGDGMFYNCYNLTAFNADLPSMTYGYNMFNGCKLDAQSVKNIIDTINTYSGSLTLGMGCNNTTEDKNLFAQEVGYADMTSLLEALKYKRWNTYAQYNGRPKTTYSLRRTVEDTLPVFVKFEEVEEHADYTSLDDSKKYRLNWFHETTGSTEGYTQYASLEEAIESLNIKPIERN